jgi:hypothetical protein
MLTALDTYMAFMKPLFQFGYVHKLKFPALNGREKSDR